MAAGSTYTPIQTYTFPNSTTRLLTMSSIPSTYTDLRIVVSGSYTFNDCQFFIQFNGDTATNYSQTWMYGNGSAAGSARVANSNNLSLGWYPYPNAANSQGQTTIDIMNYANTTTYKSCVSRDGLTASSLNARVGLWRSTSAINSITFDLGTYNNPYWTSGSTITIYGILAA
jgi:hypothetical protein